MPSIPFETRVTSRLLRRVLSFAALSGTLAITGLPAASAHAAAAANSACSDAGVTQPFASFGDTNSYELVPGGNFEGGLSGWTLSGGAHTVTGGAPVSVTGAGGPSLSLPAGASAQTPLVCVDAAYPTFRFFARNSGLLSTLLVQVVYKTPVGLTVVVPVGTVALSSSWQPTASMQTGASLESALSGGTAQIALRFTALTGSTQIDDVYVDPRVMH
jgi:hypothetical protein